MNRLERFTLRMTVQDVEVSIVGVRRHGSGVPIVFMHGFGSTKEDYADIVHRRELDDRPVLAYDAPGCGESTTSDPTAVSIPFLAELAQAVLDVHSLGSFHVVGHSMGGLTALRLATAHPSRVRGFVNIEGNLAPEDCFLSRQIIEHPRANAQEFFDDFRHRVRMSRFAASALYASALPAKVRPEVVRPIFESMVDLSDHTPLLDDFLHLSAPRMLMFGTQNASLSYLQQLGHAGVELAEIPDCGHFPMYSNPGAMWDRISDFVRRADRNEAP